MPAPTFQNLGFELAGTAPGLAAGWALALRSTAEEIAGFGPTPERPQEDFERLWLGNEAFLFALPQTSIEPPLYDDDPPESVEDFDAHVAKMAGFHRRYMVSNKICRLWVKMVRQLDIEKMVPQHGRPFFGKAMVHRFFDWFERLECGTDWFNEFHYRIP
jgi:hypothetical protein